MAEANPTPLADFSFEVNLSGVRPATGSTPIHEGFYKGVVTEVGALPDSPNRIQVKVKLTSEGVTGRQLSGFLGVPKSADDNQRAFWRAALESAGYTAVQLDAGAIKITPALFKGREVSFHFVPKNPEAGAIYEQFNFLPPAVWAERSAAFVPGSGVQAAPYKAEKAASAAGGLGLTGGLSGLGGSSGAQGGGIAGSAQGMTAEQLTAQLLGNGLR